MGRKRTVHTHDLLPDEAREARSLRQSIQAHKNYIFTLRRDLRRLEDRARKRLERALNYAEEDAAAIRTIVASIGTDT